MPFEPVLVLEGVVHLGEGHGTRFEPAVEDLGDPSHGALAGGVVGVGPGEVVDHRPVQVGGANAEVPLDLIQAAVHVDPGVGGVVALPHRDRCPPEPVPADRPVPRSLQPFPEGAVANVVGDPVDLLVGFQQPVGEIGHPYVPGLHGPVDDRGIGAPAVGVVVVVGLVAQHPTLGLEVSDDVGVGLEHVDAGPLDHLGGELALLVDGDDERYSLGLAHPLVVLAEPGSQVDHAGTFAGVDEVTGQHPEAGGVVGEVPEERGVGATHQVGSLERGHRGSVAELGGVGLESFGPHHVVGAVQIDDGVVEVRSHGQRKVRRQRPGGGGPGQDLQRGRIAGGEVQVEGHGDGRVLAGAGGVVESDLEVGQRGLGSPRVGHHPVRLVDQALVPQLLERPHDAFHVGEVHGLVVVGEVDPPGLAGDVALPLRGVAEYRGTAVIVELGDSELGDRLVAGDSQFLLGRHLGGEAVAVPTETTLDPPAPHGLVTGHDVLHVSGQQVAVVGESVGKGGTVVEHVPVGLWALLDGGFEGPVGGPPLEDPTLDGRVVGAARNLRVGGLGVGAHDRRAYRPPLSGPEPVTPVRGWG